MHLTQFSDFSFRVLVFLAKRPGELVTIDQISEKFNIPRNHLVKVVHWLSKEGLIKSFRGKHGGLQLAKDPTEYRIGEIIEQTEPHMDLLECFNRKTNTCPIAGACDLENIFRDARAAFIESLNQYTLADFLKPKAAMARAKILQND